MSAIEGSLPFLHFFDGFRTSHEIQKVELMDNEEYAQLLDMDAVQAFRDKALSPNHPVTRGTAQNPDIYFQTREVSNKYYENIVDIVEKNMAKVSELTGRKHSLFDYYGAEDAKHVVVAMGSVTEALEETIDYLNAKGEKLGVVKVHLYRPFSKKHFLAAMPETVERIAVLDRTKEPGSLGEPLYLDICNIYKGVENAPLIVGGRYGLVSKDTTPTDLNAVFENLNLTKSYNPLPKYPSTSRDIALIVKDEVFVKQIEDIIKANGEDLVESYKLFDVYKGAQIEEGHKSIAYSITYRSKDKTLTDEDVAKVHEKILSELSEKLNANLRSN